jgi:nucleotide-binding universal stress UspA family protein
MQTIRHLLSPVDLSTPSAQALRYAAALSLAVDGDLTVLYVRAAAPHQSDARESTETTLEAFVSNVIGSGFSGRLLERRGEPVTEILSSAADSDVIVMGTHGRTGLQRLLLGSVTERVIRRSRAPVLAVPPRLKKDAQGSIRMASVMCAVDFSETSARAVDYAASIAAAARGRLVLVHALEWSEEMETLPSTTRSSLPSSEDDAIAGMNELLTDEIRERSAPELVVGYGPAADELLRVGDERDVDLIVVGVRRRNPIDVTVFGSTTQRLIRYGSCAVLTVRTLDS